MEDSLTNRIYKKSVTSKVGLKIRYLGLKLNPTIFISVRLLICFIVFLILFVFLENGFIVAPLLTIVIYYFIEYFFLDFWIKKRTKRLENDALLYFPMFILNFQNCKNIKKSISLNEELADNLMALEFSKVLNDINVGKSADEAMILLLNTCPSEIIKNIIISIMEANRTGNNINESVNIQLEYLREKKNKEKINAYKIVPLKICTLFFAFVLILLFMLIFLEYFWR